MPGYLSDIFGTEKLSTVLGYMLTAWAVAGIVGPKTLVLVHDVTGTYGNFFWIAAIFMGINVILAYKVSESTLLKIRT